MSFGQEMKDFINAYSVGSTLAENRQRMALATQSEQDRIKIAQANLAQKNDQFGINQQGLATRGNETARHNRVMEQGVAQKAADEAFLSDPANIGGAPAGREAIPTDGGGGGPAPAPATQAIPTAPPSPIQGTSSTAAGIDAAAGTIGMPQVAQILDHGLKTIQSEIKSKQGIDTGGGADNADEVIHRFKGASTPEEYAAVNKIVSEKFGIPLDKLTRTQQLWGAYNLNKDPRRAAYIAAELIETDRMAASMSGHAASSMMSNGDLNGAAQELVKGHNYLPTGQTATYDEQNKIFRMIDDQTGQVLGEQPVTPEFVFQFAGQISDPKAVYGELMGVALRNQPFREKEAALAKETKTTTKPLVLRKMDDAALQDAGAAVEENITKEVAGLKLSNDKSLAYPEDKNGAPIDKFTKSAGQESVDALKDLSILIYQANPGVSLKQATHIALSLTTPDLKSPLERQRFSFKFENDQAPSGPDDVMNITTADGTKIRLPAGIGSPMIAAANKGLYVAGQELNFIDKGKTQQRSTDQAAATTAELNLRKREGVVDPSAPVMGRHGQAINADASTYDRYGIPGQ